MKASTLYWLGFHTLAVPIIIMELFKEDGAYTKFDWWAIVPLAAGLIMYVLITKIIDIKYEVRKK